jgi:hypothetical protein
MSGPMVTVTDLLRDAADALDEAYKDRDNAPPATLALVAALRERATRITVEQVTPDEPEPDGPTVTQDEP